MSRAIILAAAVMGVAGSAFADVYTNNFNSMPTGPIAGGVDTRAPGNGAFWLPDNAATAGDIRDGIGYLGTRGLVVGNRGNGFDGVIDNIHTPQLNDRAGETGFGAAGITQFNASYRFRTASTTPVSGLDFKTESWGRDRTTWLSIYEDNGNLKANYSGVTGLTNATVNFNDNIYSGTLIWGAWYRVEQSVQFIDGPSNDVVTTRLYDDSNALLWTAIDTTWENYYRFSTEQAGNGNLVTGLDALQFQARFSPTGDTAYVDDISYSSIPAPGAGVVLGLGALALRRRRR